LTCDPFFQAVIFLCKFAFFSLPCTLVLPISLLFILADFSISGGIPHGLYIPICLTEPSLFFPSPRFVGKAVHVSIFSQVLLFRGFLGRFPAFPFPYDSVNRLLFKPKTNQFCAFCP